MDVLDECLLDKVKDMDKAHDYSVRYVMPLEISSAQSVTGSTRMTPQVINAQTVVMRIIMKMDHLPLLLTSVCIMGRDMKRNRPFMLRQNQRTIITLLTIVLLTARQVAL
jgi:hypothetical protein